MQILGIGDHVSAGSAIVRDGAYVVNAVRNEMAVKLSDVVFQRTELGTGGNPGDEALADCVD